VFFRQYIPHKHKIFGIKIYNLCKSLWYTYDIRACIEKHYKNTTADLIPTWYHYSALEKGGGCWSQAVHG
jgi:hypothetical protein